MTSLAWRHGVRAMCLSTRRRDDLVPGPNYARHIYWMMKDAHQTMGSSSTYDTLRTYDRRYG